MPEGWCVGKRMGIVDTAAAMPGLGAEVEMVCPEKRVEDLAGSSGLRRHCSLIPSGLQEKQGPF